MDVADVVEPSPPRSPASVRATRSSPCWARPDDFSIEAATYDVIVDCVGNASFERVAHLLNPGGALLLRAVRDRTYDLVDIPEAHRFVDTGRKRGNVVVRIAGDEFEPTPWDTDATKGSSS